jgi:hypothetical protein
MAPRQRRMPTSDADDPHTRIVEAGLGPQIRKVTGASVQIPAERER